MLAKKYRLPIQFFFNKKAGRILKSRYFLLKIFPLPVRIRQLAEKEGGNHSRFGVIISSKVSKKAVVRNRLKRTIFDFLREKCEKLPIYDYLFILYPSIASAKKEEIINELEKTLNPKP